ncbi:hypothetical protein BURC_02506 [Burkholderiaceae bacterium]|nr:hypothetical protein BURC_02506 [Burkholderiaceae bacterium]
MSALFTPGRILVDETSRFGASLLGAGQTPAFADPAKWQKAMLQWLREIEKTSVGKLLLNQLGARSGPFAVEVLAVPHAKAAPTPDDAETRPAFVNGVRKIHVIYTPPDAIGQVPSLAPDEHPLPVLAHELTHALLDAYGVNARIDAQGRTRPVALWRVGGAYPSFTEFLADVVQNMLLSELGLVLRDGHAHGDDDPWIDSQPAVVQPVGGFGRRADHGPGADMARFVSAYRAPLDHIRAGPLRGFTNDLAALTRIGFNPFAQMVLPPATHRSP